ncbi:BZ3500_MvSof-1268-A1-R1_Chr5-2g07931 [Microbotryum saponariae]|uniref:BZ3500_MvSof-1268-A1-R1_Chr5-2g07931 protein n=1 Tax=Microbotryum saponariae TaxID=289078 RepID=A0A2X0L9V2_9BASI|nr:BZ3500_MvSof-1268-A1-R1_Chr5-2g07931 [Microbotryum saponariae]SDA05800.1 BZ3501_MvSof-1269-A2-R1_Chr5-2g07753 [Microbotryum saponariae]
MFSSNSISSSEQYDAYHPSPAPPRRPLDAPAFANIDYPTYSLESGSHASAFPDDLPVLGSTASTGHPSSRPSCPADSAANRLLPDPLQLPMEEANTSSGVLQPSPSFSSVDGSTPTMHPSPLSAADQQFARVEVPVATVPMRVSPLTPAKRPMGPSLHEQSKAIPKRNCRKSERLMHEQWAQKRHDEELEYCIRHNIRLDYLRSIVAPVTRLGSPTSWNDFVQSKYFESLAVQDGLEVPTNLVERVKLAKPYWNDIKDDAEAMTRFDAALALEREEATQATQATEGSSSIKIARNKPMSHEAIKKARRCMQAALETMSTSYAQKYGLQLFAVVSSDLPELNKERFMVASPGGLAFAYRQDWGDSLGSRQLLSDFADCVTGRAFLEDKKAELEAAVWEAPLKEANLETKASWYSTIVKKLFNDAVMRRTKNQGHENKSKPPRLVYDPTALMQQASIVVECGPSLNLETDFASPMGKQKMSGADLDRIIPLLRAGELRFRLTEEVLADEEDEDGAAIPANGQDGSAVSRPDSDEHS